MKFDSLMQTDVSNTVIWSKSKPEGEFQYGGRLFFANRKQLYISCGLSNNYEILHSEAE